MVRTVQVASFCNAARRGSVSWMQGLLRSAVQEVADLGQRAASLAALHISVSLAARALHVCLQIDRSIDGQ